MRYFFGCDVMRKDLCSCMSKSDSKDQVKHWLTRFLPGLGEEDLMNYQAWLIPDGSFSGGNSLFYSALTYPPPHLFKAAVKQTQ